MAQFSVKIMRLTGSVLGANQHLETIAPMGDDPVISLPAVAS